MDRFQKFSVYLLIILSVTVSFEVYRVLATSSPTVNRVVTPGVAGTCTWFVSLDGTTPVAQAMVSIGGLSPGDNKVAPSSDAAAFLRGIAGANIKICLDNGTFSFSSSVTIGSNPNSLGLFAGSALIGSGPGTIIQGAANLALTDNGCLIINNGADVTGVANVEVAHLTIDGNQANRPAERSCLLSINGPIGAGSSNWFVHDVTFINSPGNALGIRDSTNIKVNNMLADKNGPSGAGVTPSGLYLINDSNCTLTNIIISHGAWRAIKMDDDNQITLSNIQVIANQNVGISISGSSTRSSRHLTLTNIVTMFNSNEGINFVASGTPGVVDVTMSNIVSANNLGGGIFIGSADSEISLTNCDVHDNANDGIFISGSGSTNAANIVLNNCISYDNKNGGVGTFTELGITTANNVLVTGTRLFDDIATPRTTVLSRVFSGNNITYIGNDFSGRGSGITALQFDAGTMNITARSNIGYNPLGKITSPFGSIGTGSSKGIGIGLGSTASAPVASTNYIIVGVDDFITSTGGTGVSITIQDSLGNTLASGLTTLTDQFIPIGFKVNFGGFSVAPTVTVSAN